ncbi:MAG: hypothetical protein V4732_14055 [Pseudomonadota bacterium]
MRKRSLMVLIFCCFPVVGCQQKSKQEIIAVQLETSQSLKRTKTAKPGAPVSLASANLVTISENKESTVIVLLNGQSASGTIDVKISPSEGLQILSRTELLNVHLNEDGYYQLPVSLLASSNGRYYLNLQVIIGNSENVLSRGLAVIVQVGSPDEANQVPLRMMKSVTDENIISLPAQETINAN